MARSVKEDIPFITGCMTAFENQAKGCEDKDMLSAFKAAEDKIHIKMLEDKYPHKCVIS
jgi:hypothetical protein